MAKSLPALGGYDVVAHIGEGAMGQVFKARQRSMDRLVALKVLPLRLAKEPLFIERFLREARSAAQLSHPNLVGVYDVGQQDGIYYYSMELVEGPSLDLALDLEGPLPEARVIAILIAVGEALGYAHRKGIVHRDIKPANILIAADGTTKVADLGLAKPMYDEVVVDRERIDLTPQGTPIITGSADQESDNAELTGGGQTLGTPHYMPPEQIRGQVIDGRTDLYALGVTAFRLLTGEFLFDGLTSRDVLQAHLTQAPRPVRSLRPDCSVALSALVTRLVQKNPLQRFRDAEELLVELRRITSERSRSSAVSIKSSPRMVPVHRPRRKSTPSSALVSAAALLAIALACVAMWSLTRPAPIGTRVPPPLTRNEAEVSRAVIATVPPKSAVEPMAAALPVVPPKVAAVKVVAAPAAPAGSLIAAPAPAPAPALVAQPWETVVIPNDIPVADAQTTVSTRAPATVRPQPPPGPAKPAVVATWPSNPAGLVVLWRGQGQDNVVPGSGRRIDWRPVRGQPLVLPHGGIEFPLLGAGGALTLTGPEGEAALLAECQRTNQLAIEVVLRSDKKTQQGPARIVTFSQDENLRNFTLGQDGSDLVLRLRINKRAPNGISSLFPQDPLTQLAIGETVHLAISCRAGALTCWKNGTEVYADENVPALDFSSWREMHLVIGDEWNGGRPWRGMIARLAIYSRALSATEVTDNARLLGATGKK